MVLIQSGTLHVSHGSVIVHETSCDGTPIGCGVDTAEFLGSSGSIYHIQIRCATILTLRTRGQQTIFASVVESSSGQIAPCGAPAGFCTSCYSSSSHDNHMYDLSLLGTFEATWAYIYLIQLW